MSDNRARIRGRLRHVFLTGLAVIVPLLITLIVLAIAFNYIYAYLDQFSSAVVPFSPRVYLPGYGVVGRELLVEVATPIVLFVLILLVGLLANSSRYGERAVDYFDYVIEQIPGVGSVYEGFRQMSDVMLDSDGGNFQEVVLVEFPTTDSYTLAFVTSETPESITDPVGRGEMRTLFMPMAPNPVMGGHVLFVPEDRIVDVDMTVEEGIRALVTSGVAIDGADGEASGLGSDELRDLSTADHAERRIDPQRSAEDGDRTDRTAAERPEKYDAQVDPERARTPGSIAERERDEEADPDADVTGDPDYRGDVDAAADTTPAERAGRYAAERTETDEEPAAAADRDPADRDPTVSPPSERAARDAAEREGTARTPEDLAGRASGERVGDRDDDEPPTDGDVEGDGRTDAESDVEGDGRTDAESDAAGDGCDVEGEDGSRGDGDEGSKDEPDGDDTHEP